MSVVSDFFSLLMLGIGLSMDSLALSVSCGLQKVEHKLKNALKVAFIFALVQASTPILGYFAGLIFAEKIEFIDHWIAFGLFTMGIATSIDALAAGVSLIATDLNFPMTIILIFIATWLFSYGGFYFGNKLGTLFQAKAEIFGGIVLVGLGIKILVEHLFF